MRIPRSPSDLKCLYYQYDMSSTHPPSSEILAALRRAEEEGTAYWNRFDDDTFFARIGEAWSPAENVRHLTKSIRPVAKALSSPRIMLRLLFGWPRRESVTFDELRTRYQSLLAAGGKAGRFAPSPHVETDRKAWRAKIMDEHHVVQQQLTAAVSRWPEKQLDRYQLPHPLLGKLTVREMLFFTIYHQSHHREVVERRRINLA
jgi:DinB family protein